MDWSNTDDMMALGLPDFDATEYSRTDIGTYEWAFNFRTFDSEFPYFDPPELSDGPYVDYEFPLEVAYPNRPDVEWKRPGVIFVYNFFTSVMSSFYCRFCLKKV